MDITFLGQAGLFIDTKYGSILCDPWFNPAYFASWFPFPSNEFVDKAKIAKPDYLYLSHLHHDHYDPDFLRQHIHKDATVLLPAFPIDKLERELRELGFHRFIKTKNCETVDINGLRVTIMALTAPTDGPIGDSSLVVSDGEVTVLNQNDSRPVDMDLLESFGPFDVHFLQFSGAIWYPMVYRMPEVAKEVLARKKRENQMARALRYVKEIGATFVVPSAGPPCFLDEDLFHFNDIHRDDTNIFPDQTVFLEYLNENGVNSGRLMIPDSVMSVTTGRCEVKHPMPEDEVQRIFTQKEEYLRRYQQRQRPVIEAQKASWTRNKVDIVAALQNWFHPLLALADLTCAGVNGLVLLDCGRPKVVIDFHQRRVYEWNGEDTDYRFFVDGALVETCIEKRHEDWVNELFLSCRFAAERKGGFNEHIYNFFKCLSPERIEYLEGYLAERADVNELFECAGHMVQRRCPHLKADLTRFGHVDDGVLTCRMHGWQWELNGGKCLTSADRPIYSKPIEKREAKA